MRLDAVGRGRREGRHGDTLPPLLVLPGWKEVVWVSAGMVEPARRLSAGYEVSLRRKMTERGVGEEVKPTKEWVVW